jgi:hypothetical protein
MAADAMAGRGSAVPRAAGNRDHDIDGSAMGIEVVISTE